MREKKNGDTFFGLVVSLHPTNENRQALKQWIKANRFYSWKCIDTLCVFDGFVKFSIFFFQIFLKIYKNFPRPLNAVCDPLYCRNNRLCEKFCIFFFFRENSWRMHQTEWIFSILMNCRNVDLISNTKQKTGFEWSDRPNTSRHIPVNSTKGRRNNTNNNGIKTMKKSREIATKKSTIFERRFFFLWIFFYFASRSQKSNSIFSHTIDSIKKKRFALISDQNRHRDWIFVAKCKNLFNGINTQLHLLVLSLPKTKKNFENGAKTHSAFVLKWFWNLIIAILEIVERKQIRSICENQTKY